MNVDVVIQGGRVVCGVTGRDALADVHVAHGRIVAVVGGGVDHAQRSGPSVAVPPGARVLDAKGALVLPGMIDLGVHLRDPGREHDEDLPTTLLAALRGGVTTLVALPDTTPAVDGSDDVLHRRAAASRALGESTGPNVVVAGALTRRREGKEPADLADMADVGVELFGDAAYVEDAEVLRRAVEYARGAGARLVFLDGPAADLARGGVVVEGPIATRLGLPGIPELADALAAWRHVEVASLAGLPVHLGALFSARALEVVEAAVARGVAVTASVQPWHLLLDERAHLERRYDPLLRLDPPLPTAASREKLLDAVKRGALLVSSGHKAVPNRTKDLEMTLAEAGAAALSLTLPLLCGVLSPLELARATSALPAAVLGLQDRGRIEVDARADLVVLRPFGAGESGDVVDAALAGPRAPANPWLGRRTAGRVEATLVSGRVAYVNTAQHAGGA